MNGISITPEGRDKLVPMHLLLDVDGMVMHCGPTLAKVFPDKPIVGQNFFDCFDVCRPYDVKSVADILDKKGAKLHLRTKNGKETTLKGIGVPLTKGRGVLIDLSFGISVVEAIQTYNLTIGDFAGTDLAVEMLYLLEAKSAAMNESRNLNTRLQGAKIAAEEQAYTDTLTGLKNRRAMDHILNRFIQTGMKFGLMQVDLDFFKAVNDNLGHAAGDHVLQVVAKILVDETRSGDLVARVGGDEFVLVFHDLTDIKTLNKIAGRIIERLEAPIPFNADICRISASIGTTISDNYQNPELDQMLSDADIALYASKHKGRACFTVFAEDMARESTQTGNPAGR